jgi:hypothetical protein
MYAIGRQMASMAALALLGGASTMACGSSATDGGAGGHAGSTQIRTSGAGGATATRSTSDTPLTSSTTADACLGPIGTPCVMSAESQPFFDGFDIHEVFVDVGVRPVDAPVCIAYDSQGRVSCPYGQTATGPIPGAPPCETPEGEAVIGAVPPQCVDRRAAEVVLWTCQCAPDLILPRDGGTLCTCPSSMSCLGGPTGGYCLPASAKYDAGAACAVECDPVAHPCD